MNSLIMTKFSINAKQLSRGLATAIKSAGQPNSFATGSWAFEPVTNGPLLAAKISPQVAPLQVTTLFKAGSRYENYLKGEQGITHILRRSVGLSSQNEFAVDITRSLQQMGASLTCSSTREHIIYNLQLANTDKLPEALRYLGQITTANQFYHWELFDLSFPYVKEDTERLYRTDFDILLMELLHKAAFFDQPLGQSVFTPSHALYDPKKHQFEPGYAVGLWGQYTEETFLDFQKRCLSPASDLTLLINAGKGTCLKSSAELLEIAEHSVFKNRDFNLEPKTGSNSQMAANNVLHGGDQRFIRSGIGKAMVAVAFQGVPFGHDAELPLSILLASLGGSRISAKDSYKDSPIGKFGLLSQTIASKTSCQIGCLNFQYSDSGLTGFHLVGSKQNVRKGLEAAWNEVKRVSKEGLTQEQFQLAQKQVYADIAFASEQQLETSLHYGLELSLSGKLTPLDELLKAVSAVKKDEVDKVAKKVFNSSAALAAVGDVHGIPYIVDLAN